jgi:D-alanyl-D-alanine carboxypeptidase
VKNKIIIYVLLLIAALQVNVAWGREDNRVSAIVVDARTGRILFQQDADKLRHPASLTKLMTLYLVFEALDNGTLDLNDKVTFSHHAAAQPSKKLDIKAGRSITVEEAILALIVVSANDVAVAIGEKLGLGNERRFVYAMNRKAQQLRLSKTVFRNPSGLHHPEQLTNARDMAKLAIIMREHFPHYYHYFSCDRFKFRNRIIVGHNAILSKYKETDGLKTGYISAAGYNLATSVRTEDFSMVSVVMGGKTSSARDALMDFLINSITVHNTGKSLTTLSSHMAVPIKRSHAVTQLATALR